MSLINEARCSNSSGWTWTYDFQDALFITFISLLWQVSGRFPHCLLFWEMQRARRECHTQLQQETPAVAGTHTLKHWLKLTHKDLFALMQLFACGGTRAEKCTKVKKKKKKKGVWVLIEVSQFTWRGRCVWTLFQHLRYQSFIQVHTNTLPVAFIVFIQLWGRLNLRKSYVAIDV